MTRITDERLLELAAALERSATLKRVLDDKPGAEQAMEIAGALRELHRVRRELSQMTSLADRRRSASNDRLCKCGPQS